MSLIIGSSTVSTDQDWRQRSVPDATPPRVESFPGSGTRQVIVGTERAGGVIVEGFLRKDSLTQLRDAITAENQRRFDTSTTSVTVQVNGVSYTGQRLIGFEVLSGFTPVVIDGSTKYECRVRYTFLGVDAP